MKGRPCSLNKVPNSPKMFSTSLGDNQEIGGANSPGRRCTSEKKRKMYSWEYITSKRKTIIIRFSQGFHGIDCRNSRGLKEEDTEVSVFWFPIKFFFFFLSVG